MKCVFCRHEISDKAKFCENCGERTEVGEKTCSQCGAPASIDDESCTICGTAFTLFRYERQVGANDSMVAEHIEKDIEQTRSMGERHRREGNPEKAQEQFLLGLRILEDKYPDTAIPALQNAKASLYTGLARIQEKRGDYAAAQKQLEIAKSLLEDLTDLPSRIQLAGIHQIIGWNKYREGKYYDAAMEYYVGLGLLGENVENKQGGMLFQGLGTLFTALGNKDDAEANLHRSLQIRKKLQDVNGASAAAINLGAYYAQLGDYSIAEEFHKDALKSKESINDLEGIAICLANLGEIYFEQGRHKKAEKYILQAIDTIGTSTSQWIVPICLGYLARNALAVRDVDSADRYIEKAESQVAGKGDRLNRAKILELKAMAAQQRSDSQMAEAFFQQALKLHDSYSLTFDGAVCYVNYARFLMRPIKDKEAPECVDPKMNVERAKRLLGAALETFLKLNNRKYVEVCRSLLATPERAEGTDK